MIDPEVDINNSLIAELTDTVIYLSNELERVIEQAEYYRRAWQSSLALADLYRVKWMDSRV